MYKGLMTLMIMIISSSYFRVPLPGFMGGVTIKLKPVAKAPEYMQVTFRDATLEACDNCKAMMKHANIVYNDWYHQSMFARTFYLLNDPNLLRGLQRTVIATEPRAK